MKTSELKQLIKEAVREAIQDELKDILLEAVKSTKTIVRESYPVNGSLGNGELSMDQITRLLNNK